MWLVGLIFGVIVVNLAVKYIIMYLDERRKAEIQDYKKAMMLEPHRERMRAVTGEIEREKSAMRAARHLGNAREHEKARRRVQTLEKELYTLEVKLNRIYYK